MGFKKPPIPLKNAGMYDLCKTANKLTRQLIALCIWTHIPSIQDHITDMRRLHPPSQAQNLRSRSGNEEDATKALRTPQQQKGGARNAARHVSLRRPFRPPKHFSWSKPVPSASDAALTIQLRSVFKPPCANQSSKILSLPETSDFIPQ